MKRTPWIAVVALAAGLVGGAWLAEHPSEWQPWSTASAQTTLTSSNPRTAPLPVSALPANLTNEEQRNIRVYETANQSVVNIDTTVVDVDQFWGTQRQAEGSGSGAILDREGHIVTNYHVIDGADKSGRIEVTLASNNTYPAKLVGGDKEFDVAILKIDAPANELVPIPLGSSDQLKVGQRVFAVGNPFGWDGTMTTGIISSLNRTLPSRVPGRDLQALIQTDAAMNPGNSGGPLLNTNAEMIGMCVAIASRTGQSAGVGFAIPINRIRAIMPDLIGRGHVVRADVGIFDVIETSGGLVIRSLDPDGPAAKAGLKGFEVVTRRQGPYMQTSIDRSKADRIVAMDGEPVKTGMQFRDRLTAHRPGETVTLSVVRGGKQLDVPVTLTGE